MIEGSATQGDAARPPVGVIGLGRVGQCVVELFEAHTEVIGWDEASSDPYPAEDLARCEFAVVCVNTPPDGEGRVDVTSVSEAVRALPCQRILLKSTVAPGTTADLAEKFGRSICFWPEYIGESTYVNPFFPSHIADVPFVILGGPPEERRWFIDRLLPVLGPTKAYFQCRSLEAELVKYAENAYFATKITFVNEFRRICQAHDADWHTVREGWLLDPRVEPMHTAAFERDPGFDGKCLPKDVRAILMAAADRGYDAALLAEVLASNDRFRRGAEVSAPRAEHPDALP